MTRKASMGLSPPHATRVGSIDEFFRRHGIAAALACGPAALRAPRKVWETIRYGDRSGRDDLPLAEILAIAVAERARGTGVAAKSAGGRAGRTASSGDRRRTRRHGRW